MPITLYVHSVAGLGFYLRSRASTVQAEAVTPPDDVTAAFGLRRPDLPTYRRADIESHNSADKRIWVTFKEGVYDVTEFVESHPGGKKILLAAGKQLEPFFQLYAVHRSEHVMETMEALRIANLHPDDKVTSAQMDANDPFAKDPQRTPLLRVHSTKPFNAEPPPEILADEYLTPNDIFFVRNHLPVPEVDPEKYRLEIKGEGVRPLKLSLEELQKKFPVHKITAAVQCAGNRRKDMAKTRSVRGLSWDGTAISNAEWTGVKLSDVLAHMGAKEDDVEHVIFRGLDVDVEGVPYEASIPAASAFDPRKDVLLAFQMNGVTLPRDHGYPLRVIVPGVVGARQVKWLSRITLSKTESDGHWQANDYKVFNPSIDWHNVDFTKSPAIQEYPIQSAICEPSNGTVLDDAEEVTIKGYAWSGGGRGIIRVDVSIDGGKSWIDAELSTVDQKLHREWAWSLWEVTVDIPEGQRKLDIICKAVDTSHNSQPESEHGIWNLRGLIHNAWHRITVSVPEEWAACFRDHFVYAPSQWETTLRM